MKALFILTPAIGHYAASFPVINSLNELGYSTYITVNNEYESSLNSLGYNTCALNASPFGLDYDLIRDYSTGQLKEILSRRMQFDLYENRKLELTKILENIAPEIVFIDSHNSTDFIPLYQILKKNKCKIFFLQTTLSSSLGWIYPHLSSNIPPNKPIKLLIENILIRVSLTKNRLIDRVRFLGYDDYSTIKNKFIEENINTNYRPIWGYPMGCIFNKISMLIVSPKELEFNPTSSPAVYMGYSWNHITKSSKIKKKKKEVFYISFGTLSFHKIKEIESFLDLLNTALEAFPSIETITSGGNNMALVSNNKERWKRIQLIPFLDQIYTLSICDYFISHGGLNSIKEAIHYNVPMLIYPLEGDQIGNAQKVKHYEFGLCGNIKSATVESIKSNIGHLIRDRDKYISQLQDFNCKTSYYNSTEILHKAILEEQILE
jgi:hypothetical protein